VFFYLFIYYFRKDAKLKPGKLFGYFLVMVFTLRFFVEFVKIDQTYFEKGMLLNMGQLLSIPFVLLGIYLLFRRDKKTIVIQ
jgi:prolipoprotein diacylglyceryltransferase